MRTLNLEFYEACDNIPILRHFLEPSTETRSLKEIHSKKAAFSSFHFSLDFFPSKAQCGLTWEGSWRAVQRLMAIFRYESLRMILSKRAHYTSNVKQNGNV